MSKRERHPDDPFTVADLMRVTGWSRPTVYAAMESGNLPGYQSGPGGKWFVPADAFRALCKGEWQPQPRTVEISVNDNVTPLIRTRRAS